MKPEHKQRLLLNKAYLETNLEVDCIVDVCYQDGVLEINDSERIRAEKARPDRVLKLLDILMTKPDDVRPYEVFLEALCHEHVNQPWITQRLEDTVVLERFTQEDSPSAECNMSGGGAEGFPGSAHNQMPNIDTVNTLNVAHEMKVEHHHHIKQKTVNISVTDGSFENLKERTKTTIDAGKELYVETEVDKDAVERLSVNSCLLITGPPTSGKTSMGHAVLRHFKSKGRTPLFLERPENWDNIHDNRELIILIDDAFGKKEFMQDKYEGWSKLFPHMQTCAKECKCLLVMTSRLTLLEKAKEDGDPFLQRMSTIDVSGRKPFTEEEKTDMIVRHMCAVGKDLDEGDISQIISSDKSGWRFPARCQKLANSPPDTQDKTEFDEVPETDTDQLIQADSAAASAVHPTGPAPQHVHHHTHHDIIHHFTPTINFNQPVSFPTNPTPLLTHLTDRKTYGLPELPEGMRNLTLEDPARQGNESEGSAVTTLADAPPLAGRGANRGNAAKDPSQHREG